MCYSKAKILDKLCCGLENYPGDKGYKPGANRDPLVSLATSSIVNGNSGRPNNYLTPARPTDPKYTPKQ